MKCSNINTEVTKFGKIHNKKYIYKRVCTHHAQEVYGLMQWGHISLRVCVETHQVPSVNTHVFISYEGRSETKCNLCEKK